MKNPQVSLVATVTALALGATIIAPAASAADTSATPETTTTAGDTAGSGTSTGEHPTPLQKAEYDTMVAALKKSISAANASINKQLPEAKKMRAEWGYDAAFEAVNRLTEAQRLSSDIAALIDGITDEPTEANSTIVRRARGLTFELDQRLDDAAYDIDLARRIHDGTEHKPFVCDDAVDEGDAVGSTFGSSTTGLFHSTGNRIVYDENGKPTCSTNFEFFAGRFLKFVSLMSTIASVLAIFNKLTHPAPPKKADKPTEPTPGANK